MCGRNISADRSSTIGRERRSNYALRVATREDFVRLMTEDLPARPGYFQRDVDINRRGAAPLAALPPLAPVAPRDLNRNGAVLLDTRAVSQFCAGHVPGSYNIALAGQFASWAGSLIGLDREVILIGEDEKAAEEARNRLARVGIERVAGFLAGGVAGWVQAGLPLEHVPHISAEELHARLNESDVDVIDVRRPSEWKDGHIPGARSHPLDRLRDSLDELDRTRTLAVHCKSGYRSSIACSLLQAAGFPHVMNVLGGFDAWVSAGLSTTTVSRAAGTS